MIKLIILDVDGTLTRGEIIIGSNGEELKAFNAKDGYLINNAGKKCGKEFAIITGRKSKIVDIRAGEIGIKYVYQGIKNKVEIYKKLKEELKLQDEEIAYMGDDLNDYTVMKLAGLKGAPEDACEEIREIADYVSSKKGGEGAVREFLEYLLKKENLWSKIIENNHGNQEEQNGN